MWVHIQGNSTAKLATKKHGSGTLLIRIILLSFQVSCMSSHWHGSAA